MAYTVTVKEADEPELITEGIKTFTISGNPYSTPIQVGGIGSDKTVKITAISVVDSVFGITDSNIQDEGLTLSQSQATSTYNTPTDGLSFIALLNSGSTDSTTGTIQLTLQIDGEVQAKKLQYSLTVNNPKLDTNQLQTEVTEEETYTETFVVEDIISDASETDPVVKITAVNFSPSGVLSLTNELSSQGLTLSKVSNNYQGGIEIQAGSQTRVVTVTLTVKVGDQTKDLAYDVTVKAFGNPVLKTSEMKTSATTKSNYSSPIVITGVDTEKETISEIKAVADTNVLTNIKVSKSDNSWTIKGKTGTETGKITLTVTLLQNIDNNNITETTTLSYNLKLSAPLIVYQPNIGWSISAFCVLFVSLILGIILGLKYPNKPVYTCAGN